MKKKSITLLLAGAVLTAALTGCGAGGGSSAGAGASDSGSESTPADTAGRTDKTYKVGIVQ